MECKGSRMKIGLVSLSMLSALALAAACAGGMPQVAKGPRPPQGAGPAGTQFGFWERDAEGSVDIDFRSYIARTYKMGDEAKARATMEKDGFACRDGNRPEAQPVPQLECERLYQQGENVHAWLVKFWPQRAPEAHYSRTYLRDPTRVYDERKNK
jgi:hypothetical protein